MDASLAFLLDESFGDKEGPPPMHPNRINAVVMDMRNKGQLYIPRIGGSPLSIYEWRDQELERWKAAQEGLIQEIGDMERRASDLGLFVTSRTLNHAKNAQGWELAGNVFAAGKASRGGRPR